MSKYNYLLYFLALLFLPIVSRAQSTVDTVPYQCNFESEVQNSHWNLVNGSCYNYLAIDSMENTTYGGHKSLYVTQQGQHGQPNSYKIGSSTAGDSTYVQSRVFAYTTIYFPQRALTTWATGGTVWVKQFTTSGVSSLPRHRMFLQPVPQAGTP